MEWGSESEDNKDFDGGEESSYSTSSSEEEHGVHKPMPYKFDLNQTLIEDEHLPEVTQHLSPRLFPHGNVDTTNLIERLWQSIKYTLLEARINRSIVDLIHALVGDSKTGNQMGGTLLRFFRQKQVIADSGRFGIQGYSERHTTRLREGERILQRYVLDPTTLQITNKATLQFRIQSCTTSNQWYTVSLQANYCDCPDWSSECKHLYGTRLIVLQHFQHLNNILPIVDNAHGFLNDLGHDGLQDTTHEEEATSCLQEIKDLVQSLEQGLSNKSPKKMESIMQNLKIARDSLRTLVSPNEIQLPVRGSIHPIQAHVTRNRLGREKEKVLSEQLTQSNVLTQPEKPPRQTGALRR
ncbi:hypothetical protein L7F22_035927 [Adiantum nelumboides]|nr:hypothetical protein [Adiantum nelumboides]